MSGLRSNPAFVRLFSGRLVTNVGDSIYYIASMWLIWELTGSPFYTGLAGFLVQLPTSFQFLLGPLVDRWSLRSLLVGTQLVQGVCVLAIPIAAALGSLSPAIILVLMPLLTLMNQFVYPAQNAALPRIVDDDQLVQANSLFMFALRGSDMAFNAISGVLIGIVGAVALFVVDSITFAIAVAIFWGLSVPPSQSEDEDDREEGVLDRYLTRLREGFAYVHRSLLTAMLLGGVVVNFTFGMVIAILPAFADAIGGPEAYGLLLAAEAVGTLVGALVASRFKRFPFGRVTIAGYVLAGGLWFAALAVPGLLPTVFLFFLAFVPIGATNVMIPAIVQSVVDDAFIARVSSIMSSASTVMIPVGSLLGGAIAEFVGVTNVMYSGVAAFVFLGVYFLVRSDLRTLPPVADATKETFGLG